MYHIMDDESCSVKHIMRLDEKSCSTAESSLVDNDYSQRLADALVSEIKAEMGRRGLSSRKLGALIGESSQYMSMRLDGGNPRTGERVVLNVRDLYAISSAMDIDPTDLMTRAESLASDPGNVIVGRFGRGSDVGVGASGQNLPRVARTRDSDTGEDTDAP